MARDRQIESIRQFAEDNEVEIKAWFEDKTELKDVLLRPGIHAMLAHDGAFQMVICERIWAISHSMEFLAPFLKELDRLGARLETVTPLWDRVSQQYRRRARFLPVRPRVPTLAPITKAGGYHVARPAHLHFAHLVRRDLMPMR